jgi:lipid A disaccharide synthetase
LPVSRQVMLTPRRLLKHCAKRRQRFDSSARLGHSCERGSRDVVNSDELAIMGIVEVGRVLPKFIKAPFAN